MAVYTVWAVLILGPLIWEVIADVSSVIVGPPNWLYLLDPYYVLIFNDGSSENAIPLVGMIVLTALLVGYAILRLRREATGRSRGRSKHAMRFDPDAPRGGPVPRSTATRSSGASGSRGERRRPR